MGTLTLNDGTVLLNSYALLSTGNLFIYVHHEKIDIAGVFNAFVDPAKTSTIIYTQVNGEKTTFTGYVKLIAVRDEGDGLYTAVLNRE